MLLTGTSDASGTKAKGDPNIKRRPKLLNSGITTPTRNSTGFCKPVPYFFNAFKKTFQATQLRLPETPSPFV
jgi:hypothetical protein